MSEKPGLNPEQKRRQAKVMLWPVRVGLAAMFLLGFLLLRQMTEAMQLGGYRGRGWVQFGVTFGGLMLAALFLIYLHRGLSRMARGETPAGGSRSKRR